MVFAVLKRFGLASEKPPDLRVIIQIGLQTIGAWNGNSYFRPSYYKVKFPCQGFWWVCALLCTTADMYCYLKAGFLGTIVLKLVHGS